MQIELNPRLQAVQQTQVEAGHFSSIEEALTAAVLGVPVADDKLGDLAWAKPHLDEAEQAAAGGLSLSERNAFTDLEQRYGPL